MDLKGEIANEVLILTGIDDGLGTAFQYVDSARFELFQDLTGQERRQKIETLRNRFDLLHRRVSIPSYLCTSLVNQQKR